MIPRDELPVLHRSLVDSLGHGRKNAMVSPRLRMIFKGEKGEHVSDVVLRKTVKELIEEYGWPIGSTPNEPAGFYLIETKEEMDENCAHLLSRAYSIMRRVAALKQMPLAEAVQQLVLFQPDDTVLAYLCSSCGEKTTAARRLKHRASVVRGGKLMYEEPPRYLYKCPNCRGTLTKIDP